MAKIVLNKPTSGYNLAAINDNFVKIEAELQNKVAYRDNPVGEPNSQITDIDMNGKRIYNLGTPVAPTDALRLVDLPSASLNPDLSAANAAASAASAAASALSAQTSGSSTALRVDLLNSTDPTKGTALLGFKASIPFSVGRIATLKMMDSVSIDDFGAVGDGVTNDTAAMTAFFNSAIARPGVPHILRSKTYAISLVLPSINVSNVQIFGQGADIHDIGALMSGTVLKWVGASGVVGPLVRFAPISNAVGQRLSNGSFMGIGIDCNSGAIDQGIEFLSVMECDISVSVCNARTIGVILGVVASLGEAKDLQNNRIHIQSRQIEAATGFGLVCAGDAAANVSLNEIWGDFQHKNAAAVYCINSDNNDWRLLRAFRAAGGIATESVSLLGGPTDPERVRAERFHYFTATAPLHAYGTGSYAFGSTNNKIYCLDTENGTPAPVVDVGASVHWRKDTTSLEDTNWQSYTPVLSATGGALTAGTCTGKFAKRGKVASVAMQLVVASSTATGNLKATLPFTTTGASMFVGVERGLTGRQVYGFVDAGSNLLSINAFDAGFPGAAGAVMNLSGTCEVA